MQNNKKIKVPVFVPLSLAILILLVSSIIGIYWLQRRNYIERVQAKIDGTRLVYSRYLDADTRLMNGLLDFIEKEKNLQQDWLEQNRDMLFKDANSIFGDIRSKYNITHLYFHRLDKTCFLRVHNPAQYDDVITRATMQEAAGKKEPIWGIELGKYGTFTLRVVHPWFIDGKLTGYIELGEEIERFLPILKDVFDVELFVVIDKKYLTRPDWETGMQLMKRDNADWNLLADKVIVDSTFSRLSGKSLRNIKDAFNQNNKSLFDISVEGRNYTGGYVSLTDAGGRVVGDFIVMKDITKAQAELRMLLLVLTAICVAVGVTLCALFYAYIRRVEKRLTDVYLDLQDQIEKRKQAEEELQRAYNEVELEVQSRTSELSREVAERKKYEEMLQRLNDDLKMTVDKLTNASRELEQFAFITSHHLREPVRKISTFGRILSNSLSEILNSDQRENLNFMIDGANKIELMVKGLKLYLESSVEKIEFKDIDLNLVVEEIRNDEAAGVLAQTKGNILIPEKLPAVKGNPLRIRQVLQQVIMNGLQYHKDNIPPEVVLRAYKESEDMVRIEIEDNGIGIKQEYLNEMFNPFKRLCSERNREGIGIGLAISKKVIGHHGGKIGAKSIYGQGATIWFTLPLAGAGIESEFAASPNSIYNADTR